MYVDINIPWSKQVSWSMIVSLRLRAIQFSLFLIRQIMEVTTSRSAIQSYWIYKHDPLGTVAFSYEALLNETYHEVT